VIWKMKIEREIARMMYRVVFATLMSGRYSGFRVSSRVTTAWVWEKVRVRRVRIRRGLVRLVKFRIRFVWR